jgi:hypothetical protein
MVKLVCVSAWPWWSWPLLRLTEDWSRRSPPSQQKVGFGFGQKQRTVLVRSKFVQLSRGTVSAKFRSKFCYYQQCILQQIGNMLMQCVYINLFTYQDILKQTQAMCRWSNISNTLYLKRIGCAVDPRFKQPLGSSRTKPKAREYV